MRCIKPMLVAGVFTVLGFAFEAAPVGAQQAVPGPIVGVPAPRTLPAAPGRSYSYGPRTQGTTPAPMWRSRASGATTRANVHGPVRDWTTGRELRIAKPWLRPGY